MSSDLRLAPQADALLGHSEIAIIFRQLLLAEELHLSSKWGHTLRRELGHAVR